MLMQPWNPWSDQAPEFLTCAVVAILTTTRTVLGLRAEREYPVPPLPLSADLVNAPAGELAASSAVALFVDRARAVRHDFTLTQRNARAVAQICRRLEGLPLAIELAAARTGGKYPLGLIRHQGPQFVFAGHAVFSRRPGTPSSRSG
jgi:hypothetical protein